MSLAGYWTGSPCPVCCLDQICVPCYVASQFTINKGVSYAIAPKYYVRQFFCLLSRNFGNCATIVAEWTRIGVFGQYKASKMHSQRLFEACTSVLQTKSREGRGRVLLFAQYNNKKQYNVICSYNKTQIVGVFASTIVKGSRNTWHTYIVVDSST
jgi:hypothetical protein